MELVPTAAPAIKGAIPECLDAMSRHRNARQMLSRLQQQIEALRAKSFDGLTGVFAKHLLAPIYRKPKLSQALSDYLGQYWFDHSSGSAYFPELQPIAPLYAEGVLTTLGLSLRGSGAPLPIDAWWLVDHRSFEMINLVSKQQVTLLIATPHPGRIAKAKPQLAESEVWTTRRSKVESQQVIRKPE